MSRFTRRSLMASPGLLGALALITATIAGAAPKPKKGTSVSGTTYAATTHTVNGIQYIAGQSTDSLLGDGAVTYTVASSAIPNSPGTVKLTVKPVTSWYPTGSLTGTAKATLVIGAGGAVTVSGTLTETSGKGALKGHSFVGTFTGTGSLVSSQYKFTYKGTYK